MMWLMLIKKMSTVAAVSSVVLLGSLGGAWAADDLFGSNSVLNIGKSNYESLDKNKAHFIKFYAPWCGHCKRLAPTWEELAERYNTKSDKFVIGKVDCTEEAELCTQHDIAGYPTLKFFDAGAASGEKYKGSRELEDLETWVLEKVGGKKPEKTAKGMFVLDGENFMDRIRSGRHFVKFYAPWCGHCKNLAPTWDQLAEKFADNDDVTIAKLDCTQHGQICKDFEVKGYPTLMWIDYGKKNSKYSGARGLSELTTFVNEMTEKSKLMYDPHAEERKEQKKAEQEKKVAPQEVDGDATSPKMLTDDTFDAEIAEGVTFVKFFAPWCGHCKHLAPTWADLAKKATKAKIAKVDCTENESLCSLHEVQGYPTLLLYKDGKRVEEYHGSRDLDALQEFVNRHLEAKKDEL